MKLSTAVSLRIKELAKKESMSINKLAINSCVTQSTLQSIVQEDYSSPTLLSILRICYGLNITVQDFFNSKLFIDVDLNI